MGTTLSEGCITSLFRMKVGNSKSLSNIDDCVPKCVWHHTLEDYDLD